MSAVNGSDLAKILGVTKGRVSQLAAQGKLAGCYAGDGRERRYDPEKVAHALQLRLDPGQKLGNGAKTQRAIGDILASDMAPVQPSQRPSARADGALPEGDEDSYELQRKAKLAEEVRRLRRQNALEEGTLILATEVERQVARVLRQELAEIEELLRTGARAIADRLGVDFRAARQILVETWRAQRRSRTEALDGQADAAELSEVEKEEDI